MCYSNFSPSNARYSTSKNVMTLKLGLRATQDHRNWHSPPIISYFQSKHGSISCRFWNKCNFGRKSLIFPTPVYFVSRWRGSPWSLVPAHWVENKRDWWGYRAEQEVWRYLQMCGYNPPMCRTADGQTLDDSKAEHVATILLNHSLAEHLFNWSAVQHGISV